MARNKSFNAAEDLNFGTMPVTVSKEKIPESNKLPIESEPVERKLDVSAENKSDPDPVIADVNKTVTHLDDREQNFNQALDTMSFFQKSKKENRSVKKTILIKQSTHDKLKKITEEIGTSMNDVINEILEQMLKDV